MSNNTNVVVISGNVVKELEVKAYSSGLNYVYIRLATNKYRLNPQTNEWDQSTTWSTVRMLGDLALAAKEKLRVGQGVIITGELSSYMKEDTKSKFKYETHVIEASSFEPVGKYKSGKTGGLPTRPHPNEPQFEEYPEAQA